MTTDEKVRQYILSRYREERPQAHLSTCPSATVTEDEADFRSFYDTGVEGMWFTARLTCPHESEEYEFGELGDLPSILSELDMF